MVDLLARLAPDQAGALWIGALIPFLVLGDHDRLLGKRNLALIALVSFAPFLYDILDVAPGTQAWALRAVFLLTGAMAAWGVRLSRGPWASWQPHPPTAALKLVALCLIVASTATVFARRADDAGVYTNLGAQRWTETGRLPYGDERLKGPDAPAFGAAATYGPLLYAAHVPFLGLTGGPRNDAGADPRSSTYRWPEMLATQATSWTFLLIGLAAFFFSMRKLAGERLAWASLVVLTGLPYFVGLGGATHVIGGVRFVSHIAPMAVTLLAFAALSRPALAGALLAAAAGVLFYPAFLFPIWLAWYLSRRQGAPQFAAGFVGAGLVIALVVFGFTDAAPGESRIGLFLESTLEHQEGTGPREYGASAFSFWTYHATLTRIFQTPLLGDTSLFKLSFILFAAFCLVLSALARDRTPAQLAGLSAAAAAAVQLWKTHASGSYIEWYLPFLLIALFAQLPDPAGQAETVGDRRESSYA